MSRSTTSALIGHTGLVGNNLARQHRFDDLYNSANIGEIAGKHYEVLVCSGVSGTKWLANKDPERDRTSIANLLGNLEKVSADFLILISTVDVHGVPAGVDEDSPVDISLQTSYGKHRYQFEQDVCGLFPSVLTVRLPAIYGWGLRKNALYDLMHKHELEKIHPEAAYQFYWLEHLWRDMQRAKSAGLSLIHIATEPLGIQSVANEIFGIRLTSTHTSQAPKYDFRTKHDALFHGANGYLYDKATAMEEIRTFVAQQRLCQP